MRERGGREEKQVQPKHLVDAQSHTFTLKASPQLKPRCSGAKSSGWQGQGENVRLPDAARVKMWHTDDRHCAQTAV